MKAAPAILALGARGIQQVIVHTGQHYDLNMSEVFFQQLGIPQPDINLGVGPGTQTAQTALVMTRLDEVAAKQRPDLVLVYGDVNSTMAAALVCVKARIRIGHVEAGLRSFDRSMPEEINRLVTDQLADFLFTPSEDGNRNLEREGIDPQKIFSVGNLMIDTLVRMLPLAKTPPVNGTRAGYALVTLHRPSNVDEPEMLRRIVATLSEISGELPVVFPMHPRTRQRLSALDLNQEIGRLGVVEPMGYLEFLALQRDARVVITDSGGVQEETTFLGVPCLTVRENTERPITVEVGTNLLVGRDMERLKTELGKVLAGRPKAGRIPPLWDGKSAQRVADIICRAEL